MNSNVKRLNKNILEKDIYSFHALKAISNYQPHKENLKISKLDEAYSEMTALQGEEAGKEGAYKAARDNCVAAEQNFHNLMLEAKEQVRAQFGSNSNELQSLGLKKKEERKAPGKRKAKA